MNNAVLESELSRAYDKMELLREETAHLKERVRVLEGALRQYLALEEVPFPTNPVEDERFAKLCETAVANARSALHTTPEVGESK